MAPLFADPASLFLTSKHARGFTAQVSLTMNVEPRRDKAPPQPPPSQSPPLEGRIDACQHRWLGIGAGLLAAALLLLAVAPPSRAIQAPPSQAEGATHADRERGPSRAQLTREPPPIADEEARASGFRVRLDGGMQAACRALPIELVTEPRPSARTLYAVHEPDSRSR